MQVVDGILCCVAAVNIARLSALRIRSQCSM
jgi:hypothetical protein